jgi:hypothetical protein
MQERHVLRSCARGAAHLLKSVKAGRRSPKAVSTPKRWSRTFVQGGLASALALVGLVAYSAPAFGHNNLVNATGSCASPLGTGYVITWNIANDYNLTETGHITSVTGGLGTLSTTSFSLPASPGTPYASVNVTQTLPASASGTITLDTDATWSDGFTTTDSGTFNLASLNCAAPVQTIAGHIYLCNNSNPTTTEETGGTLSAPTTPPVSGPNPLGPTNVAAGTFTMTANAPPHYQFTDCGGFTGSGGTATQSVTVPSGGHGVGLFYVWARPSTTTTWSPTPGT